MANHYDVPSWAGKPPVGLHLDVMKGDKLIQKLMLDEKKCYLFGRNPQMCDFCIDHQSCSRVHAAFVYHKTLHRAFLVDLGSTHGTYIGSLRIEANMPTQLPIDSNFHFGASTRNYIIRERPQTGARPIMEELEKASDEANEGILLGLPETETELDNLTEFNTAHNRRITMLGIGEDTDANAARQARKRKRRAAVTFNEEDEIINPEDIDPSVGRFRNLIHSTVVPSKRVKMETMVASGVLQVEEKSHHYKNFVNPVTNNLYSDLPGIEMQASAGTTGSLLFSPTLATRLGLALPNPAPDVDIIAPPHSTHDSSNISEQTPAASDCTSSEVESAMLEPRKKKYAKEAWPGKKTMPALLV